MYDQSDGRHTRVVVINDDTVFLGLMQDLLESEGDYDVRICKTWDGAYELVKDVHPDLVILDIVLAGGERGWEILNLLTLDPVTRPIPVLVCSAAIQSLHAHQPFLDQFGIHALPKPFDLDALLAAIDELLARGRPPSSDGPAGPPI